MARKSKKDKRNKVVPSKKSKPQKTTTKQPVKAERPVTSATAAPAVKQVVSNLPAITDGKVTYVKRMAQVGRWMIHEKPNDPTKYRVYDTVSKSFLADVPSSIPLEVVAWIVSQLAEVVGDAASYKALDLERSLFALNVRTVFEDLARITIKPAVAQ